MNMSQQEWDQAMTWWDAHGPQGTIRLRQIARAKLSAHYAGTGQGISSSDINWEIFYIWKDYVYQGSPEFSAWLADMEQTLRL